MRNKHIIFLACIAFIAFLGFMMRHAGVGARPVLVLKGYAVPSEVVKGFQIAKLELRNTTKETVWFLSSGDYERPIHPAFVMMPNAITSVHTYGSNASIRVQVPGVIGYADAEKVLPSEALAFDWPVLAGHPPERAGIAYYFGNFKNEADFATNCLMQTPGRNASWRDKLTYCWHKCGFQSRHEVWCREALSFQTNNFTNLSKVK